MWITIKYYFVKIPLTYCNCLRQKLKHDNVVLVAYLNVFIKQLEQKQG